MDTAGQQDLNDNKKSAYVPPSSFVESMSGDTMSVSPAGAENPLGSPTSLNVLRSPVLFIEIADAMSEKDRVIFTIHTKTTLPDFASNDMSVTRSHEDFVWLHEQFEDNPEYGGLIIPPCPPKPDFEQSREKLMKLTEADGALTEEEITKMKSELEAEYLATFKKTVAMHDVFLKRLAAHPSLRDSYNLRTFLEYAQDLNVKVKSRRQQLQGYLQRSVSEHLALVVTTTTHSATNELDDDEELKATRESLTQYYSALKDVVYHSDRMTNARKSLASQMLLVHTALQALHGVDTADLAKLYDIMEDLFEKLRKTEARIASDEDLKLSDTVRYYRDDSQAALSLLHRRLRALQDHSAANKNLEKARSRDKDVASAETAQQAAHEKAKLLTDSARAELRDFRVRRIAYFKRQIVDYAELQVKNNVNQLHVLRSILTTLKSS